MFVSDVSVKDDSKITQWEYHTSVWLNDSSLLPPYGPSVVIIYLI